MRVVMTDQQKPEIQPGKYRHFKGAEYQILGLTRHSETEAWLVSYRCLYGDYSYWVRPLELFNEWVKVEGVERPRFEYVGEVTPEDLAGIAQ